MSKIIDDKFVNVTNDIEKVQTKPTMYISYIGDRAFLHLTKEIINNGVNGFLCDNSSDFEMINAIATINSVKKFIIIVNRENVPLVSFLTTRRISPELEFKKNS